MADIFDFASRAPIPAAADSPQVAEWRAGLAKLRPDTDPCPGYRPGEWPRVLEAMKAFLDAYGEEAVQLSWTTRELFAVHDRMGIVRSDGTGAMPMSTTPVAGIDERAVTRGNLKHYRGKPGIVLGPPIWELVASAKARLR